MAKQILIVGGIGGGNLKITNLYDYYYKKQAPYDIKPFKKNMITINDDPEANPKIINDFLNLPKYNLKFNSIYFEFFPFISNIEKMMDISYVALNQHGQLVIVTGTDSYLGLLPILVKDINIKWKLKPINKKHALRFIKI